MTKETITLPNFLRAWRKKMKLTQERLAELAGFTPGAISQFETGVANFTIPSLVALADVLGCRPGDILSYPPSEGADDEARFRSALLAYGVDKKFLDHAVLAVSGFRVPSTEAPPQSDLSDDRSEPASRPRGSKPSRARPLRSFA